MIGAVRKLARTNRSASASGLPLLALARRLRDFMPAMLCYMYTSTSIRWDGEWATNL